MYSNYVKSPVLFCTDVLQNHLVSGVVYSAYVKAKGGVVLKAESGQKLNVTVAGLFSCTFFLSFFLSFLPFQFQKQNKK